MIHSARCMYVNLSYHTVQYTVYYYTYFTIYKGPSLYISRHLTRSYAHFADLPAHLPIALPLSSFNFTNKKTLSSSF